MNLLFFFLLSLTPPAVAHEGHQDDLKAIPTQTGTSIFQLASSWKDQKGETVKLADLRGKYRLLVMLFTRCETACPLLVEDLKEIAAAVNSRPPELVEVSIFSLDSFRETPESLLAFSVKRKLPKQWNLLTSNADAVAELAAALGVRYKRLSSGDFIHSNVIYFLNKNGEVVAQKEGLRSPHAEFIKQIKKETGAGDVIPH